MRLQRAMPARVLFPILIGLCIISAKLVAQAQSVDEYRLKAAFLFHFVQMVDWPGEAQSSNDSFFLCTYGEDPFQNELEHLFGDKPVGARRLRVHHVRAGQDFAYCQVLFVSRQESKATPALLARLGNAPVLTVGETEDFLEQGGMIRFCLEGNKVRFEINLQAAGRAHIKISSRLLLLAKEIKG